MSNSRASSSFLSSAIARTCPGRVVQKRARVKYTPHERQRVVVKGMYVPSYGRSHQATSRATRLVRTAVLCRPHLCVLLSPLVFINDSLDDVCIRHALRCCAGLLSGWSRQQQAWVDKRGIQELLHKSYVTHVCMLYGCTIRGSIVSAPGTFRAACQGTDCTLSVG